MAKILQTSRTPSIGELFCMVVFTICILTVVNTVLWKRIRDLDNGQDYNTTCYVTNFQSNVIVNLKMIL